MKTIKSLNFLILLCLSCILHGQNNLTLSIQSTSQELPHLEMGGIGDIPQYYGQITNPYLVSGRIVELRVIISGNGIELASSSELRNNRVTIDGSIVVNLDPNLITGLFNIDYLNFRGYTKEAYINNGGLPEGMYRVCFELIDVTTDEVVRMSNEVCILQRSILQDPPILLKLNQSAFTGTDNVIFNWMPRHFTTSQITFDLEVYRLIKGKTISEIVSSESPAYSQSIMANQGSMLPAGRYLYDYDEYFGIVRAYSTIGNVKFKNNGYSNEVYFRYYDKNLRGESEGEENNDSTYCEIPEGIIFINEISQGCKSQNDGTMEYIELVVAGDGESDFVDLSGIIIDDNNYMFPNIGNEGGHIRLGNCFSNVPVGSIILIYNDLDIHPMINTKYDGMPNAAGVYQLRFSSTCIDKYPGCPNQFVTDTYDCPKGGNSNRWDLYIPMRNTIDLLQLRYPDGSFIHGVRWSNAPNEYTKSTKMITMDVGNADGLTFLFDNGYDWNDVQNWSSVTACGSPSSPGVSNSSANKNLITGIKNKTLRNNFRISCSQINVPSTGAKIDINGGKGVFYISVNNGAPKLTSSNPYYVPGLLPGYYQISVVDTLSGCVAECDLIIECKVGAPCDDGDSCTTKDVIDRFCNCKGTPVESIEIISSIQNMDSMCYCTYLDTCYGSYFVDYIRLTDPNGSLVTLDNNTPGFSFPYCTEGVNGDPNFPGCGFSTPVIQMINDLNAYILYNGWRGIVEMSEPQEYCGGEGRSARGTSIPCTYTNLKFKNVNFIPEAIYFRDAYEEGENSLYGYSCPEMSDTTLTVVTSCDPISYIWSTGDTTATILIDPSITCYQVTVTCETYEGVYCEFTAEYGEECNNCEIGTPCDDGNPCTTFDHYDFYCDCVGIPIPGCDPNDPPCQTVGQPCNDYNDCTINDVINADCECEGEQVTEVVVADSIVYDTLCNYCIPLNAGAYNYSDTLIILTHSVHVTTSDGMQHVLNASLNYAFFNFPYCYGSSIDCTGYPSTIQDLPNDISDWLDYYHHHGNITGTKGCSPGSTGLFITNADFDITKMIGVTGQGDTISMLPHNKQCFAEPAGYHLYIESGCDSIMSYMWSTGEESSTITIDSLAGCYKVTITCGVDSLRYCELVGEWGENCDSCAVGQFCDDGNPCTFGDAYNASCECIGTPSTDSDGDGYCDDIDVCFGFDDAIDTDGDGVPDGCDLCHGQPDSILPQWVVDSLTDDNPSNDPDLTAWGCGEYPCEDSLRIIVEELTQDECSFCLNLTGMVNSGDPLNHISKLTYFDSDGILQSLIYDKEVIKSNDDFNNGIGTFWNDGGTDCIWQASSPYGSNGTGCMMLRDNTSSSIMTTDPIALCNAYKANLSFSFITKNFSYLTDKFVIQQYKAGVGFIPVKEFKYEVDFINEIRYFENIEINGPFNGSTYFRIRCYADNDDDQLFIDDVKIVVQTSENYNCTTNFIDLFLNKLNADLPTIGDPGIITYINGYSELCDTTGNVITIENTNISLNSVEFINSNSQGLISFTSPDCQDLNGVDSLKRLIVSIDCDDPTILWSNGMTSDTIIVPSVGAYSVTVTCPDSCSYTYSVSGDCIVGSPCQPDACYNNDGYLDEWCNCIGGTLNENVFDYDGDGLCGPDDPCPCDGDNVDTDGDGICDCLECPTLFEEKDIFTEIIYAPYCDILLPIYQANGQHLTYAYIDGVGINSLSPFTFPYCYELSKKYCENMDDIFNSGYTQTPSLKAFMSDLRAYFYSRGMENFVVKDSLISGKDYIFIGRVRINDIQLYFKSSIVTGQIQNCISYPEWEKLYLNLPINGPTGFTCFDPTFLWNTGSTSSSIIVPINAQASYCVTITCANECEYVSCTEGSCIFGDTCIIWDTCHIKTGVYDEYCNCKIFDIGPDADNDGVTDKCDKCPGFDDKKDKDNDGIPDGCDDCAVDETKKCDYCSGFPYPDNAKYIENIRFDISYNGQQVSNSLNNLLFGLCIDPIGTDECPSGSQHQQMVNIINNWITSNGYQGTAEVVTVITGSHPCCPGTLVDDRTAGSRAPACTLINITDTDLVFNTVTGRTGLLPQMVLNFNEYNCVGGQEPERCDDGDPCTINDIIDEDCNCVGTYLDSDDDFVCDYFDVCPGHPDYMDEDGDGIPNGCDTIAIACTDSTYLPFCEYLEKRLYCANNVGNVIQYDLRMVQSELYAFFDELGWNTTNFYIPRLMTELQNYYNTIGDADEDGIINYLDPCPCTKNPSLISTGLITQEELEECCSIICEDEVAIDGTQANLLVDWMFGVQQGIDKDENGNITYPYCAAASGFTMFLVDSTDITFRSDTCSILFTVDCDCNCDYKVIDDYDGDGICNTNDTIYGDPCTITCADKECHIIVIENCECKYIPIVKDTIAGSMGQDSVIILDSDGDGVCDFLDECPGLNDTIDSDGDGLSDCKDPCVGGWMGVSNPEIPLPTGPGDPCDDGNPCTYADSISVDCNCEGIILDLDDDGITDCGDCKVYFDDPVTPDVDFVEIDKNSVFISCDSCYVVGLDSDNDGMPDMPCDICPDLPDTLDYNGNGAPDCIDPSFKEIGCPDHFALVLDPQPGIMLSFNSEEIELDDLPNPIGMSMIGEEGGQDNTYMYDYLTMINTREVDGTFEAFYPLPVLDTGFVYSYIAVSYANHQNCVLTGGDNLSSITCPTGFTIGNTGNLSISIDLPSGTSPDLMEFLGTYTFDLDSVGNGSPFNTSVLVDGNAEISNTGGLSYNIDMGSVGNIGPLSAYNGTITLPNGVVCPYDGANGLAECINDNTLVVGDPCDDGDSCTHHDRIFIDGMGICECKGDPKPDNDGDGICDEFDPCPDIPNTSAEDLDGDGYPDCECPPIVIASDSITAGGDIMIGLDPASAAGLTGFTYEITGGPDGPITQTTGAEQPMTIANLPKGYTYEIKIIAQGQGGCVSDTTITMDMPFGTNPALCGIEFDEELLLSVSLLPQLNKGDEFIASDFTIYVKEAKGSYGKFTGKGYIQIPVFGNPRINVTFKDITIASNYQMVKGIVVVNGFGFAVLGDPISDIINDGVTSILTTLTDISDILDEIIPVLEAIDELITTTESMVSESTKNCIQDAKNDLDSLKQLAEIDPNHPNIVEQIKVKAAELQTCMDQYENEVAAILNRLPPILNACFNAEVANCSGYESFLTEINNINSGIITLRESLKDDIITSLPLSQNSNTMSMSLEIDSIGETNLPIPIFNNQINTEIDLYYEKETAYQVCAFLSKLELVVQDPETTINNVKLILKLFVEASDELSTELGTYINNGLSDQEIIDLLLETNTSNNPGNQSRFVKAIRKTVVYESYKN